MEKAARELMLDINKELGPNTVVLGGKLFNQSLPRITSGSLSLDVAMGGGWPTQRWNEIYGDESSGKTAVLLKTIAANQRANKNFWTWWVAGEDFDVTHAEMCGVDLDRIMLYDDNLTEPAYQKTLKALRSRAFDCVVIDSLPAMVPEGEANKEMGENLPMLQARLNSDFLRRSRSAMKRSLTEPDRYVTCFAVNQWREKMVSFGDPRFTPGGRGKNYWFSIRLELKRDEWIEVGRPAERVGQVIKVLNYKNKSARPQQVAVIDFHFADHGPFRAGDFDELKEVIALGLIRGIIKQRKGGYYLYNDQKWHGHAEMVEELRYDVGAQEAIRKEVLASLSPAEPPAVVEHTKPARRPRR